MRHQKSGRKFGRKSASRHALFSNMVSSLIEHERIQTTDPKAKELRRIAERTISWATSVGNLIGNEKADAADKARVIHAMRMAQRVVKHKPSLAKLFSEIGPRMAGRPGGYLRIMKLRHRHGDAAPISIIEFVDRAEAPVEDDEAESKGKKSAKGEPAEKKAAAPKKKAAKQEAAGGEKAEKAKKKPAKKKEEKSDE
ncbi:MAG TPA: 50S ribosomal protein L17 [Polyangia bacterium]|nr:50S ribosomal protein L17 [Polyangia bacterium]